MRCSNQGRIHQKWPNQAHTPKVLLIQPRAWKNKKINIQYIWSSDNAVDLFTETLPTITLRKLIRDIEMRARFYEEELLMPTWWGSYVAVVFFHCHSFVPQDYPVRFLTRQHRTYIQRWCTLFSFRYSFIPLGFPIKFF